MYRTVPEDTCSPAFHDAYAGKRVFVTGHTGFKGSWLCEWLNRLGARVTGYSIGIPTTPSLFEGLGLAGRIDHRLGDVRDYPALAAAMRDARPDVVFHLAAQPIVLTSYEEPKLTFDTNVGGTLNVLEAIRQLGTVAAAVVVTSDKCYENVEWEYGYRESDRLGGKDPYSASKAGAEIVFSSYWRSFFSGRAGLRAATARAGNVIGGGDWAKHRIVPDCMRAWSAREFVDIRNPRSTRPWQHVLEPLSGYLWLGSRLLLSGEDTALLAGEAYNFGPPPESCASVAAVVQGLKAHWPDVPCDFRLSEGQSSSVGSREAGLLQLCCDKAFAQLGWQPTLTFPETLRLTADWYREVHSRPHHLPELTTRQIGEYESLARSRQRAWTTRPHDA